MALTESLPAFNAFENQLKTLCLNEFPCGVGTWKEDDKKKKASLSMMRKSQLESKYSITLKNFGASHEKTETLEELVTSKTSPWNLDYSWSDEAKQLREMAVRSPWLIDENFVLNHFRTLRIADKRVTEVDPEFLKFKNLQELTLSANHLKTVNSRHLPRDLKVLELCANEISNLADLCIDPPPLIHLGLGYNRLYMIEDYITGDFWPNILSLDLSYNNLADLMDVIRKLQTLPKLRNLALQGNPLSLVPGYRGYTIDSLRKLDFLDEISISADEKHHYKGLAKRKEYVLDEAKFIFAVDFIRGIPMPEELQNPEDQPEFPIVTKKYFIQFMFLKDSSVTQEIFHMLHDSDQQSVRSQPTEVNTARQSDLTACSHQTGLEAESIGEKNVIFAEEIEHVQDSAREIIDHTGDLQNTPMPDGEGNGDLTEGESDDSTPVILLGPVNSSKCEWAEEMELEWKRVVARDNLLALRDFLKQGMQIKVMEEKILSYPVEPEGEATPNTNATKSPVKKEEKKKEAKLKKDNKGKRVKTPAKGKDDKKKKKKGESDVELQHMPAEYTTITTFQIPLEDILEMEYEFENVFRKNNEGDDGFVTPASVMMDSAIRKEKKKERDSANKKKGDAAGKKKEKDDKKDKKGGKGGDKKGAGGAAQAAIDEDEPPPPPPPLEVGVSVRLIHWETAAASLKPDLPEDEGEGAREGGDNTK